MGDVPPDDPLRDDTGPEQGRDGAGRYLPGASGNARGRPPGVRNKVLAALDALAEGTADEMVRAMMARAKAGDTAAAGLIFGRIWPVPKGRVVQFDLPPITSATDLPTATGAVVEAVAAGILEPSEAATIMTLLDGHGAALERADMARRIEALESAAEDTTE